MPERTSQSLAEILPHLREGDHITAEFRDGCTVDGPLTAGRSSLGDRLLLGEYPVRQSNGNKSIFLTEITSAPEAEARANAAERPAWADGTPADDESVFAVEERIGADRFPLIWLAPKELADQEAPNLWHCASDPRIDGCTPAELISRGARPVARYITAEPDADQADPDVDAGAPCTVCGLPCAWGSRHRQCAEPESAAEPCDRDHEPAIGSVVRDRNGVRWQREMSGWRVPPVGLPYRQGWTFIWVHFGPLTLVEDGTNTGAGQ